MSGDGFTVDLDALGVARDRVGHLAEELGGPPRDVPDAAAFGHDRLAAAVGDFAEREKRGLARLASEAEEIRDELAETIDSYRRADEDGADRFGGIVR